MNPKLIGYIIGTAMIVLVITLVFISIAKMNPVELYTEICKDYGANYVFIECYNSPLSGAFCDMDKVGDLCEYPNGTQFKVKLPTSALS